MRKLPAFVKHDGKTYLCKLGEVFRGCNTFVLDVVSGPHDPEYVNEHNMENMPLGVYHLSANGYTIEQIQNKSIGLSMRGKLLQKIW
jgi:hypothetical protein